MKSLFLLTTLLFGLFSQQAWSKIDPNTLNWELKEEKKGIRVFRAPRHEETGIIPIKAETILDYSMPRILSVLATTERKVEWIPKLLESHIVEKTGKYSRVEYSLYDSPWPFHDRAFVIKTSGRYNEKENTIYIDMESIDHPEQPLNEDHVRGHTYMGTIFMRGIEANKTFIELTLLTDFRGNIPTWIINMVQAKWPYNMFRDLRKQLEKDDIKIWPEFQSYDP